MFFRLGIILFAVICVLLEQHSATFVPKGRKCRLQEQHCDIMHPEKQCCPGTSCGIRRINNKMVNICQMCRDIGQPCGVDKGSCCHGLRCQKITQLSSVCNPVDYKFFTDHELDDSQPANQQKSPFGSKLQVIA